MRRSAILLLPLMILLLCGNGYGHEQTAELDQQVEVTKEKTSALQEGIRTYETEEGTLQGVMTILRTIEGRIAALKEEIETQETDEECDGRTERRTWEQFFNELDSHNGDQAL